VTDFEELERRWPTIRWRLPITVTRTEGVTRYACRACIASYGLRGADVHQLYETPELVLEHIEAFHLGAKP